MKKNLITKWQALGLVLMGMMMSGCDNLWFFRPTSEEIVKRGWANNKYRLEPEQLYCYRTLADPVCYSTPQENAGERIVGYYGNRP